MFDINHLHHAYICLGDKDKAVDAVFSFFKKNKINTQGNPDLLVLDLDNFSIDQARKIVEQNKDKPFGNKRFFIIKANNLPFDTQNTLLKLLEEPGENTHFFLILPIVKILPTLQSRVVLKYFENPEIEKMSTEVFLKEYEKGNVSKSDAYNLAKLILKKKDRRSLEKLIKIKKYIFDKGSSLKQLLEYAIYGK